MMQYKIQLKIYFWFNLVIDDHNYRTVLPQNHTEKMTRYLKSKYIQYIILFT